MKLRLFNSIQAKLIALFLLSVFFTIIAVVSFNQSVRNFALASADTSLRIEAEQLADEIDNFNERNLRVFAIASSLPILNDYFHLSPDEQLDSTIRQNVRSTLESLSIRPYTQFNVSSFALLDLEGDNLLDTFPAYEGDYEGDREYFIRPTVSGQGYTSELLFETHRGGAFFYYSVPIRDVAVPHPIVGVLRVQISVSAIQNILLDYDLAHEAHIVLVDENSLRLLDNTNEDWYFRTIEQLPESDVRLLQTQLRLPQLPASKLAIPLPEIADALNTLDEVNMITNDLHYDGQSRERIAMIALETQSWVLLYGRHVDEFFAPINQQTQAILILSAVLVVGAVGIAFLFSRSLSKPIVALTQITGRAAKGDLDVQAEVSSKDEIGSLAQAFNTMIHELKQNKTNLEQRVHERTLELSESNQKLQEEVDERQRLEQRNIQLALESERTRILADFIQNVSHEFKTPLSIINVQSHMINRITDDTIDKRIKEIIMQSKNIEVLVNEMVMMSRLDGEIFEFSSQVLYFDEFIRSVILSEEVAFSEKQIELEVQTSATGAYIEHNSQMLFTAVKYILDNALHFTQEGGHVRVKTEIIDDNVNLTITDNGIGIPAEDIERVFERFYRVDEARTTRGFGLGLPIAQRIIERFGGTIHLDSELGAGTTVTMKF